MVDVAVGEPDCRQPCLFLGKRSKDPVDLPPWVDGHRHPSAPVDEQCAVLDKGGDRNDHHGKR